MGAVPAVVPHREQVHGRAILQLPFQNMPVASCRRVRRVHDPLLVHPKGFAEVPAVRLGDELHVA
eukprot:3971233-Pyramimonas_sp.AAC.1